MSHRETKLYVGNLSPSTTRGDLEKEFGYYGHLVNVWVARNPPGFAYVEFEAPRDAEDALRLDGRSVGGRRVRVEIAHGMRGRRDDPIGGGGGRGGDRLRKGFNPMDRCYNCGERGHYAYDCSLYRSRRGGRRSYSRSRSRSPRRRSRSRSRSYRRSRRRTRSRSSSRSRSRSRSHHSRASRSRSHSKSRSRSRSGSAKKTRKEDRNGHSRSPSRSKSRSPAHSHSPSRTPE